MLEYNLIFVVTIVLLLLNELVQNKLFESFSLILVFALIVSLAGFRFEISSDYYEYNDIFNSVVSNGYFSLYFIEPGFLIINQIVGYFKANFQVLIFTISFLSIGFKFFFIQDLSNKKLLSALLFFAFYLFLYDLGAIRRGLALGITSYGIIFYLKNQRLYSFLMVMIAASIHVSAVVLLPVIFFKHIKYNLAKFIFVLIISFVLQIIVTNLIEFSFLAYLDNPVASKAYGYFQSGDYFVESSSVSLGLYIRVLLISYLIYRKDILLAYYPYADKLIHLFAISIIILIVFDRLRIFTSINIFFKITELLLIPHLFFLIKKPFRFAFLTLILVYCYLSFYNLVNHPVETDYLPYNSIFKL